MTDREIPVIADPYVDKEFGTGCVKITPAHDPNDFEVGKRQNLEEIVVINDDATMNKLAGKYEGMGWCDLHTSGSKLFVYIWISDHRNLTVCHRKF